MPAEGPAWLSPKQGAQQPGGGIGAPIHEASPTHIRPANKESLANFKPEATDNFTASSRDAVLNIRYMKLISKHIEGGRISSGRGGPRVVALGGGPASLGPDLKHSNCWNSTENPQLFSRHVTPMGFENPLAPPESVSRTLLDGVCENLLGARHVTP